jgi:hypothetical protein
MVILQAKSKTKSDVPLVTAEVGVKRAADAPEATVTEHKKKKKTILESLFHEDGGGAVVNETYACRSVGARGFVS